MQKQVVLFTHVHALHIKEKDLILKFLKFFMLFLLAIKWFPSDQEVLFAVTLYLRVWSLLALPKIKLPITNIRKWFSNSVLLFVCLFLIKQLWTQLLIKTKVVGKPLRKQDGCVCGMISTSMIAQVTGLNYCSVTKYEFNKIKWQYSSFHRLRNHKLHNREKDTAYTQLSKQTANQRHHKQQRFWGKGSPMSHEQRLKDKMSSNKKEATIKDRHMGMKKTGKKAKPKRVLKQYWTQIKKA